LHFLGVGIIGKHPPQSVKFFNKGDPDINRRFAHQGKIATPGPKARNPSDIDNDLGVNLIRVAADASLDAQDGAFERMAYMNGLTFLLKGLPSDLDTYEAKQIRSPCLSV
jgi:hypothetical protein